jgi:hypothetical protein
MGHANTLKATTMRLQVASKWYAAYRKIWKLIILKAYRQARSEVPADGGGLPTDEDPDGLIRHHS